MSIPVSNQILSDLEVIPDIEIIRDSNQRVCMGMGMVFCPLIMKIYSIIHAV